MSLKEQRVALVPRTVGGMYSAQDAQERRDWVAERTDTSLEHVGSCTIDYASMRGNVENPIGSVQMPLGIAGPSHGRQVSLPLLGWPIVPSRLGQRLAAGRIVGSGQTCIVSTGIGTSILPVKFGVPPEVSIVRLESNNGE